MSGHATVDDEAHICSPASSEEEPVADPLLLLPPSVARENDHVILVFADGRHIFAQCVKSWKGKSPPLKINKRNYPTSILIGLPYGTVLELGKAGLTPLPQGEDILPGDPTSSYLRSEDSGEDADGDTDTTMPIKPFSVEQSNDNRHLVDSNSSQAMQQAELVRLKDKMHGSAIVKALIENSSTFDSKTDFSKAKYIARKQKKYQIRCRMVRCTASSICETLFLKDPRKLMNLREDTLAQILSYSNVTAGCRVLVVESCMGTVTGALAQRMGGYGQIFSLYNGQQPSFFDLIARFNLSFAENHSIKWVHSGDVFSENAILADTKDVPDVERLEREAMEWPCPLQDHTRVYLETLLTNHKDQDDFLAKRCARFARKLTRHSPTETQEMLLRHACDTVIVASRYDPTSTLLAMLPFLAPSCPFVVFCEFLEPLTECFQELQRQSLAINLRLSDTWMREYQVLPGRTHPNMSMSQNGGFLLTGIKLCPETGHNDLDEDLLKELKAKIGGRRGRRPKHNKDGVDAEQKSSMNGRGTKNLSSSPVADTPDVKRARVDES